MVPQMMTAAEAARQAREFLDGDHPIPVEIGRALLAGYEAATNAVELLDELVSSPGNRSRMPMRFIETIRKAIVLIRGPDPGVIVSEKFEDAEERLEKKCKTCGLHKNGSDEDCMDCVKLIGGRWEVTGFKQGPKPGGEEQK